MQKVAGASEAIDRVARKIREREIKVYIKEQGLMLNKKNIARAEQHLNMEKEKERVNLQRVHEERKDRSPSPVKSNRSKSSRVMSRKHISYPSNFVRIS